MKPIYFTPGPSELYFTMRDHMRTALSEGIPSIYHRSTKFQEIHQNCVQNLKQLLNLPDDYRIAFTASATEIWERITLNLIEKEAFFINNGTFSARFSNTAEEWGKKVNKLEISEGRGYDGSALDAGGRLIGITHNESSTGVMTPMEHIYGLKANNPDSLLAVDIVSSVPTVNIEFEKIDTAYFSVQKCFGLPAGLGVWLFNNKCLEKAVSLEKKGVKTGSYHRLTRIAKEADMNLTPSTPNILGIYLLNKVVEDMLEKGLEMIRREIRYKAAVLNHTIEDHPHLIPFVEQKEFKSPTLVVANTENSEFWVKKMLEKNMLIGTGYAENKKSRIRIANFPTHSKEQIELLADEIVKVRSDD